MFEQPELCRNLIAELRAHAASRASVRDLDTLIRQKQGYGPETVIPVLAYFCKAFCLPLIKVLPIREWIGTSNDAEIDRLILPEIEKARTEWDGNGTLGANDNGE